jgi:hypothetical protein
MSAARITVLEGELDDCWRTLDLVRFLLERGGEDELQAAREAIAKVLITRPGHRRTSGL